MSLSKIFKSLPDFEPVGIVRKKVTDQRFVTDPPLKELGKEPVQPEPTPPAEPEPGPGEQKQQPPPSPQPEHPPEPQAPPTPPGIPEEEVERLVAEARQQGFTEGMQQAEADFGAATSAMQLICSQMDNVREMLLQNSIAEIRELVLAISEKVIRHSLADQHDTILQTVNEAISLAVKSDDLQIFVNPGDFDIISGKSDELITGLSGLNNLTVHKDPTIEPGGCRLESDKCTVDATLVSQLEIIRDTLFDEKDS